jgi:hypothetical protein
MQSQSVTMLVSLLAISNGAPLVARILLGPRFNRPLDRNRIFIDGQPLLGSAKTIRGIISALIATTLTAPLFNLSPGQGAMFALLAMIGDLISSFTKRRLGIASSRSAPLLDQLPESLLPLWLMHPVLAETPLEASVAILVFVVIDVLVSRVRDSISRDAGDAG